MTTQTYRQVAAQGAFWNIGLAAANKVITFVGQIALVWLLVPADMGLANMAIAMSSFVSFLSISGLDDVLVQRGKYRQEACQGLWLSIGLSFVTSILICVLAIGSRLANDGALSNLLFLLSITPLAFIFNPVLSAYLKLHLNFKHLAISQFIGGVVYTSTSLILAWNGMGAASLIIPIIPRSLFLAAYMKIFAKLPSIESPRNRAINHLFAPTIQTGLSSFFFGIQTQTPVFIVGLLLDSSSTGIFSWGWLVASQSVFLLSVNLKHVLLPIYAKLNATIERQNVAVMRVSKVMTAALILACGFQALIAKPILVTFFPQRWHAAGDIITWISLGLCLQGIYTSVSAWFNSSGKYYTLSILNLSSVLILVPFVYFGCQISGIKGAAIGSSIGLVIAGFIFLFQFERYSLKSQFNSLFLPGLLSMIVWGICFMLIPENNLANSAILSFCFLAASSFIWIYFDGGTLKSLIVKNLSNHTRN